MYAVGDHVVYGTNGVCKVNDIRSSPFDENDARLFYVLAPIDSTSNLMIYTPTEGGNIILRDLVSVDEARRLFSLIPGIECVSVPVEKKRRDVYRDTLNSTNLEDYVRIIKTVARRRLDFKKSRRRLPDLDNDYEHTARTCLYGELADVLGMCRDEINRIINEIIEAEQ